MPAQPLVSVVTATYNMADYLPTAVDSVLNQTYKAVEVIVVDDGSTDHTADALAPYADDERVRVVRQENAGQTVAKNRGLAEARGEYVGFCDADDAWYPDKLVLQLPCFDRPDAPGLVYGDTVFMDAEGIDLPTPRIRRYSGRITGRLLADNFIPFPTCLAPRRVLEEFGGFDESLTMAIDYDLWLRISTRYEIEHVARPLARYRIWGGQMSHRHAERMDNALRMMERFLAENPGAVTPAEERRAWAYTYTTLGLAYHKDGRREAALTEYQRALEKRPHDWRTWMSLIYLVLGRGTGS